MKKVILIITALLSMSIYNFAQIDSDTNVNTATVESCLLTVEISGMDSDKGTMMVAIYDSEAGWLSQRYAASSSNIQDGKATVAFADLPLGIYGISTYQDENDNKKLDTRIFGIPKEPYASSRGAMGMFGPPKWEDAKFELKDETHTELIKY